MPRTAAPHDIPERLLSSGLALFLRQGYNATGIQALTDHAGVPKGSFYNHFASKDAFAAAIVARYADQMLRSWERMMKTAPAEPMAAIRHVFAEMVAFHERSPRPTGCLIGNFAAEIALTSEACRQNLLAAQLGWRQRLAGLVAAAQARGDIRRDVDATALSALVWAAWEGALLRMKVEHSTAALRESVHLIFDQLARPTGR